MRILVISDSHRKTAALYKVAENLRGHISAFFFLGDNIDDVNGFEERFPDVPLYKTAGNCDFHGGSEFDIAELSGKRIMYTHGHHFAVKSGSNMITHAARDNKADICLFGHTHDPEIFESDGILFLNPGSISLPRGRYNFPSYGIINIEGGRAEASVVGLTKQGARLLFAK